MAKAERYVMILWFHLEKSTLYKTRVSSELLLLQSFQALRTIPCLTHSDKHFRSLWGRLHFQMCTRSASSNSKFFYGVHLTNRALELSYVSGSLTLVIRGKPLQGPA